MAGILTKWDPSLLLIAVVVGVGYTIAVSNSDGEQHDAVSAFIAKHVQNCALCRGTGQDGQDGEEFHSTAAPQVLE